MFLIAIKQSTEKQRLPEYYIGNIFTIGYMTDVYEYILYSH